MNGKTRIALIALVFTLLVSALVPPVMAGDQFNLLTGNNYFDTPNEHGFYFLDPWWSVVNKSKDKLRCFDENVAAFSGDCAFRFKGSATEASKLIQVVTGSDLDTVNAFAADAPINMQLSYQVNSLSTFTNLKAKAVLTIAGSDTKIKVPANFSGSTMIGDFTSWQPVDGPLVNVPQNTVITKVKVLFANKSTQGTAYIDNVEVLFASGAIAD